MLRSASSELVAELNRRLARFKYFKVELCPTNEPGTTQGTPTLALGTYGFEYMVDGGENSEECEFRGIFVRIYAGHWMLFCPKVCCHHGSRSSRGRPRWHARRSCEMPPENFPVAGPSMQAGVLLRIERGARVLYIWEADALVSAVCPDANGWREGLMAGDGPRETASLGYVLDKMVKHSLANLPAGSRIADWLVPDERLCGADVDTRVRAMLGMELPSAAAATAATASTADSPIVHRWLVPDGGLCGAHAMLLMRLPMAAFPAAVAAADAPVIRRRRTPGAARPASQPALADAVASPTRTPKRKVCCTFS